MPVDIWLLLARWTEHVFALIGVVTVLVFAAVSLCWRATAPMDGD